MTVKFDGLTMNQLAERNAELVTKNEELQRKVEALAVENVAVKKSKPSLQSMMSALDCYYADEETPEAAMLIAFNILRGDIETPATHDAIAEIVNKARAEGVNFAASRLAAAFNHGFIAKPLAEVFDVTRMILTAKEDIANSPAADGLSGDYAETTLKQWEEQLRKESRE